VTKRGWRDRILVPPVMEAMASASGIVAAGAGGAAGILVAGPIGGVAGALLGWGARVAAAVPRAPRRDRIEPYTLDDPWRRYVVDAVTAGERFAATTRRAKAGPLRDRLDEIGQRVNDGVAECWRVAQRGAALVEARAGLDPVATGHDLAALEAEHGGSIPPGTSAAATARALQAQIDAAERMDRVIGAARDTLRLSGARLAEAVARAVELSVQTEDAGELQQVDATVGDLVEELETLHRSMDEVSA
jgi:hypothetical protein